MKGAAMKLGQVMSFLDVGLVPEEYREEFQRKLARAARRGADGHLQGDAQGDRGGARRAARRTCSPSSTRSRSPPPRSARCTARASHDGREVAVKVQYPGVAAAVRADMQNLGLILRLLKRIAPGHRSRRRSARRSASGSTRSSTTSSRPRTSARWRGSSAATRSSWSPTSSRSLSRERVMVSRVRRRHRVRGAQELPARGARPDRRDPVPLLLRLPVPPPPVLGRPPPGQLDAARRRPDGVPRLRAVQADAAGRGRARDRRWRARSSRATPTRSCGSAPRSASSPSPSKFDPEQVLAHFRAATSWYTVDEYVELTPEYATQVLIDMSDPALASTSGSCATSRRRRTTSSAGGWRC